MADAFGEEDIFAVFEDNSGSDNTKKRKKEKEDIDGPSTSADVTQIGEKREFKPDVIDLALDDSGTKKAKLDDLERWLFILFLHVCFSLDYKQLFIVLELLSWEIIHIDHCLCVQMKRNDSWWCCTEQLHASMKTNVYM